MPAEPGRDGGGPTTLSEPLLLDDVMPTWDHVVCVSRVFQASPDEVYDVATNLDMNRIPLIRLLLDVRLLPDRVIAARARRRGEDVRPEPSTFRVRDLPARGWLLLGERPGVELAYGVVDRARTASAPWEPPRTVEEFVGLAEPGFIKLAESTRVDPHGSRACVLTFETRVAATDEASRRQFQRYWSMVGPFVRLMRPVAMGAVERELRRRGVPAGGHPAPV